MNHLADQVHVYDAAKNIYSIEQVTGFALRPFDNVGVQYGVAAFNSAAISVDKCLLLNEKVGSYDHDANYIHHEVVADALHVPLPRSTRQGLSFQSVDHAARCKDLPQSRNMKPSKNAASVPCASSGRTWGLY
ncbi:MAG TPA: DUF6351 family protein [Burkholderiaceae bacterium]|nr:DUF6351 family protein [Burkholderiaceae bacterium]